MQRNASNISSQVSNNNSKVDKTFMRKNGISNQTKIMDTEGELEEKKKEKKWENDNEVSYTKKADPSQSKWGNQIDDNNLEHFTDEQKKVFVKHSIDKQLLLKGYEIVYPQWLIPIRSRKNFIWNIVLISGILIDYFIIPFELCSMESEWISYPHMILLNLVQIIYFLDIIVKFRKTYYDDENNEIVSSYQIAYKYFNSFSFLLDCFTMMPCFSFADIYFKGKGYPHLILLLRLLKIGDMPRIYFEFYEYCYIPKWVNFIFYLFSFMYIIHIETCIWYAIISYDYYQWDALAEGDEKDKLKDLVWLPPTYRNIETDTSLVDLFYKGTVFHKYCYLFYQISYVVKGNEIGPISLMQNVVAALFVFLGLLVMGVVFGEIASTIEELNQEKTEFSNLIDDTHVKLTNNKISQVLSKKVMIYLDYCYHKEILFKEGEHFSDLSESLQKDLVFYRHQDIIINVPLFADLDPIEIHGIIKRLKTWIYMPGDNITTKGEKGNEMFFIIEGSVEVIIDKGSFLEGRKRISITLPQGSFFGEIALISNSKRTADVNAQDFCIMEILTKADYDELLEEFPSMRKKLKSGIKRMKVSSLNQIIDAFKRNPMFKEFPEEELKSLVRNYVEITYVDPQQVITRPTKRCKAFYLILVGTVSRYDCSRSSVKYIKQLNRSKKGQIAKTCISFDEELERQQREEEIQNISPAEVLQRGRWLGSMPCGKVQRNVFFDVADSAVQLAVLTTRSISEMMTNEPKTYNLLREAYMKHVEPEKKKETLNLQIPDLSQNMSRNMDETQGDMMSGLQSPNPEVYTPQHNDQQRVQADLSSAKNDAQVKEQIAAINFKINQLMKKCGKEEAYKKLKESQAQSSSHFQLTNDKKSRLLGQANMPQQSNPDAQFFLSVNKVDQAQSQQKKYNFIPESQIMKDKQLGQSLSSNMSPARGARQDDISQVRQKNIFDVDSEQGSPKEQDFTAKSDQGEDKEAERHDEGSDHKQEDNEEEEVLDVSVD